MNQIKTVIDNAGPPEPLHESDEQVVEKLARLSPLEYDKQRKEIAKKLNARIRTLDDEVKKLRSDTSNTQGKIVEFEDPAAWHETVDGSDLFNSLTERIARHMAIPKNMANVVALWIVHSHCFEEFTHSARLIITAPEKECGKTVLLSHLVGNLVSKPQHADNVTPAVFFRLAQSHKPTFLIDEVDSWLREDSQLPSALNGGFESHGRVLRCEGDNNEVREFSTFAPTAMAGINLLDKLPPPIISRSIVIELQRSLPGEVVENYDQRKHRKKLHTLRQMIARWVQDNIQCIHDTDPQLPEGVLNRQADKWRPLAAIAEVVGGKWPGYVKTALFTDSQTVTVSKSEQLLADIGTVISRRQSTDSGIYTDTLIAGLCELDDSLWAEYNFKDWDNKNIAPRQLSNLLKHYKIKPATLNIGGERLKGYRFDALLPAINRFVSPAPPDGAVTPLLSNDTNGSNEFLSGTSTGKVTDRKNPQPNDINGSNGVTDSQGVADQNSRTVTL